MKKSNLLWFAVLLLGASKTFAGTFCIGNFSSQNIQWQLMNEQGVAIEQMSLHPTGGSSYRCALDLDTQKEYLVSIRGVKSGACDFKKIKADDWINVSGKDSQLQCGYESDVGNTRDAEKPMLKENTTTGDINYINKLDKTLLVRPYSANVIIHYGRDVAPGQTAHIPYDAKGSVWEIFQTGWINIGLYEADMSKHIGSLEFSVPKVNGYDTPSCKVIAYNENYDFKVNCDRTSSNVYIRRKHL